MTNFTSTGAATGDSDSRKLFLMRWVNERDNKGKQNAGTWPQIAKLFSKRDVRPNKSGKAFSPARLKPGTTRAKANVQEVTMAVADIDDGTVLDELRPNIAGFSWVAYSSHSHMSAHWKYRIVFPLARSCAPTEWPAVWDGLNELLA